MAITPNTKATIWLLLIFSLRIITDTAKDASITPTFTIGNTTALEPLQAAARAQQEDSRCHI